MEITREFLRGGITKPFLVIQMLLTSFRSFLFNRPPPDKNRPSPKFTSGLVEKALEKVNNHAYSQAYNMCKSCIEERKVIPDDLIERKIRELYHSEEGGATIPNTNPPGPIEVIAISIREIKQVIAMSNKYVAPHPSGLSY